MEKKLKDLRKEYDEFISLIPERLTKIGILLKKELTYDFDEIDLFQEYYTKYCLSPEKIGHTKEEFDNMFYTYVGEAHFSHCENSKWQLCELKRAEVYGHQIVVLDSVAPITPFIWSQKIIKGMRLNKISAMIKAVDIFKEQYKALERKKKK